MTDLKKNLSDAEKVTYIRALLFALGGKKNMSDVNKEYLKREAEDIELSLKDLRSIPAPADAKELTKELKKLSAIRLKRFIVREMIMLALADHEISDEEMKQIYLIGMGAGLKEEKINDCFIWAAQGLEWQIAGDALIEK